MIKLDLTEAELCRRLALNVRARRLALALTLKKAGERADIYWRYWQKIEAAEVRPTLLTLVRLSHALAVEPAELLRETAAPLAQ